MNSSMLYVYLCMMMAYSSIDSAMGLSINNKSSGHHQSTKNELSRRNVIPYLAIATVGVTSFSPPSYAETDDEYITTPRGLKYKVTQPPIDPDSPTPERAQKVKASYTLYLNGFPEDTPSSKKVDSSKGLLGDKPFGFMAGVSQVIKGWDLAITDMRVGEARKLIVNSDLGYGDKGAGGDIPGGATLYFDVELKEIGAKAKIGPEQVKWLEEHPL